MRTVDLRGIRDGYDTLLPRAEGEAEAAAEAVKPILAAVRERGSEAVLEYGARFDDVRPAQLRVPREVLDHALSQLAPDVRAALEESVRRLRVTCAAELEGDVVSDLAPGARVEHRKVPIDRVGLYVPGGLAPLLSSVVMNVVPAQVAGVPCIALSSPPQAEHGGWPHPTILGAAALLGVDEVYAAGGAQAIAMLAYGTEDCRPVNLITGPGNIYVTAAKRQVMGRVGIDSEAGPTEIAILADSSADAAFIATDLMSQAEHDPLAAALLVTDSAELVESVREELDRRAGLARHAVRIKAALVGDQSGFVLTDDLEHGIDVVNAYAAEHLEIHTRNAEEVATRIRNAGAVFVGAYAPVSLGDYCAGSNHVLPTAGCACHSSGLSVRAFIRSMHVVHYSRDALAEVADHVVTLAEAEDLPSHGAAVSARFES